MELPILHDVKERDWKNYSIGRAIRGQMNGRLDGFEAEMDRETSKRIGQNSTGVWIPPQAFASRGYVAGTGNVGGFVVETSNLGSQFVDLLRAKAIAAQLGARILNLQNPVTIPQFLTGGTCNWMGGGETAAATVTAGTFGQLVNDNY
jgi:hypothetical protein